LDQTLLTWPADGDIDFGFALEFDNHLSPKLFQLWCKHISQCFSAIDAKEPELRQRS
jgi:hypothetical protein